MKKRIKSLMMRLYIRLNEHTFQKSLKYLFYKNNSDTLVIGFSGMSVKPCYNYVRALKGIRADRLYLLDDFAYAGSYHWYSHGKNTPEVVTQDLISQILNIGGGIKRL